MLERLRLIDFKSFVDEAVELSPLTLLVGANASGKSNLLDALRFLQRTTFDMTISDILDGEERAGVERWPGLRGGSREAARVGSTVFTIESTWSVPVPESVPGGGHPTQRERGGRARITHRIACRTAPSPKLEAESLNRDHEEGSAESAPAVSEELSNIRFLNIKPAEMRGYGRRISPLGEEGKNISGVLARLCDDPEEKRTLVEWLAELCAPELIDLDFIDVPEIGDVMAVLIERGGRRITARSLSDGTLRFLGLLVALRSAEPGSTILIEEIESDLHPTRIRLLVEYLEAAARERDIQIIATTHSPVVLQWLSEETLLRAIVLGRVPEREGTVMRRLGDLPHLIDTLKRKGIDELFTTGWLEMAL